MTEIGDFAGALDAFRKSLESDFNVETLAMIAYIKARQSEKAEALSIVAKIRSELLPGSMQRFKLAKVYGALGEIDTAIELLEESFEKRELDWITLRCDTRFKSIEDQPRFQILASQIGRGNEKARQRSDEPYVGD
ncbi:MAG: hypothetical protein ABI999_08340 [Acidobacteriota bacterium]